MPIIDSNDKKSITLQKKNYEIVLHPMHGATQGQLKALTKPGLIGMRGAVTSE